MTIVNNWRSVPLTLIIRATLIPRRVLRPSVTRPLAADYGEEFVLLGRGFVAAPLVTVHCAVRASV